MLPPPNYAPRNRQRGLRSAAHRKFIRTRLCAAWQLGGCVGKVEVAHCRDVAPNGHGGPRPGDEWCIGLCRKHHREAEKRERAWGAETGIDVRELCIEYAEKSPDKTIREAAKSHRSAPRAE